MKPSKLGVQYDQLAQQWHDRHINSDYGVKQFEKALEFVSSGKRALDVGCSTGGRFIQRLEDKKFSITGIDVSKQMIKRAKENHPDHQFLHRDICEWDINETFDFILAWDSLWHIPLEQQEPVLKKLVASLNRGGVLFFSFGGSDESGDHTDDFMGPEVYYATLGTNRFIQLLINLGCVCRHLEYDQYPELHAYLIVQKK